MSHIQPRKTNDHLSLQLNQRHLSTHTNHTLTPIMRRICFSITLPLQLIQLAITSAINNQTGLRADLLVNPMTGGMSNNFIVNQVSQEALYNLFYSGLKTLRRCFMSREFYDPHLGHIPLRPKVYCTAPTFRHIPRVTCCAPQTPADMNLVFLLYQPRIRGYSNIDFFDPKGRKLFSRGPDLVFLIHAFMDTPRISPWMNDTRNAFLAMSHPVIIVDWSQSDGFQYFQASANLRSVGAAIGYAIIKWQIIDRVLIVGHSLGAQMIGEVGKYVRRKTGRLVKECHALDPAGPFFDGGSNEMVLDKGDCRVLQVIHSAAGFSPEPAGSFLDLAIARYGTYKKTGHCDFWINCGHFQEPECRDLNLPEFFQAIEDGVFNRSDNKGFTVTALDIVCSHLRATLVYSSSVNRRCRYKSFHCPDCGPAIEFCHRNGPVVNSLPPFSRCDQFMDIDYMMRTTDIRPYCSIPP